MNINFSLISVISLLILLLIAVGIYVIVKLYRKAYYDDVTVLHNRVYFREKAKKILKKKNKQDYALIVSNIVHFRTIYGCYGPEIGDLILRFFAKKLLSINPNILLCRAKEDKFQILLPYKSQRDISNYLERLSREVHTFHSEEVPTKLYIRCGVGLIDGTLINFHKMLSFVELARKEAIKRGEIYYIFDQAMADFLHKEKDFTDIFEISLRNNEFKLYYQAKYDIVENKVIGAEALIRWNCSSYGFMRPDEFIPVFERNGFIIDIDYFVLEEVCKMLRSQIDAGKEPVPISVNQSRLHLLHDDYCQRMAAMIEKYKIPPKLIELEITETVYMDLKRVAPTLIELKKMGYMLAIDDFGNGYSSFPLLFNVPIDSLKIDKDFISSPGNIRAREILLKMIVEISKELKLNLVCEGVENKSQVDFLLANGCKNVQGYLYAKPVPQEDFLNQRYLPIDYDI